MTAPLRNSTIEFMRKRVHGVARLRLYKLRSDGESLTIITTLIRGFLIQRNADTQEGAPEYLLTIDRLRTAGLTDEMLTTQMFFVGLVNENENTEQRYEVTTMTPPLLGQWRYVGGLHPRLNDEKPVI